MKFPTTRNFLRGTQLLQTFEAVSGRTGELLWTYTDEDAGRTGDTDEDAGRTGELLWTYTDEDVHG